MIYNPTLPSDFETGATKQSAGTKKAASYNFSTILCVAWSSCGRNVVLGTPDGLMVFSTEHVLADAMAAHAQNEQQQRHSKPSPMPPRDPNRQQSHPRTTSSMPLGTRSDGGSEQGIEEDESLASLSPLDPREVDGEETWDKAAHPLWHSSFVRDVDEGKDDARGNVEVGDYLGEEKEACDEVGVREVCRRLIEGGVGTVALYGQSSILAVAGAPSPRSLTAAKTVKVVDVSEPYSANATPPHELGTSASPTPGVSEQLVGASDQTVRSEQDQTSGPDGDRHGEGSDEGAGESPVGECLPSPCALDPAIDVVGPAFPSGNLARVAREECLVRAAREQTFQQGTAPPTWPGVSDAASTPQSAPATAAEVDEAVNTFRRANGPAILCEQLFTSPIGALCLTAHYLVVVQTAGTTSPELSRIHVYDRQWQRRLFLFFCPSSNPRFVRDCVAPASTWCPVQIPSLAVAHSAAGMRYHHALLPGDMCGEVRVLSFQLDARRSAKDARGAFAIDRLQAFTSTPVRAVAITSDGTRAVVTSEEGKRIKLLQVRNGAFEKVFLSLDRGLTRAVNNSVSLCVVNVPDAPSGTTSPARYALVSMITTTGTVHFFLVDVARRVQWECLGTDTRLRLVHEGQGVSSRFPEPTISSDRLLLFVLQYSDGAVAHAEEHAGGAEVSAPFRFSSYQALVSSVTRAERPPAVVPVSLMKSASTWLKRDVVGSKSSGIVPTKAEGGVSCRFGGYLSFF